MAGPASRQDDVDEVKNMKDEIFMMNIFIFHISHLSFRAYLYLSKKELGQYSAILTSRFDNNPYMLQ